MEKGRKTPKNFNNRYHVGYIYYESNNMLSFVWQNASNIAGEGNAAINQIDFLEIPAFMEKMTGLF